MSVELEAVSIREPWCTLITSGRKAWEYRHWKPKAVPPFDLVLCTTKGIEHLALQRVREAGIEDGLHPLGCAVAIATYQGALHWQLTPPGTWGREGMYRGYGWRLENVRLLRRPVAVRGRLGLFKVQLPLEAMPRDVLP